MKFGQFVGAVSGLVVFASAATAQVCQGDLSFRNSSTHVAGSLAVSNNASSFGGGVAFGHSQGWYGGGSLGVLNYDNISGNSVVLGGGLAYALPMQRKSRWQVCPGGTFSMGFGPNVAVGGGSMHLSTQNLSR